MPKQSGDKAGKYPLSFSKGRERRIFSDVHHNHHNLFKKTIAFCSEFVIIALLLRRSTCWNSSVGRARNEGVVGSSPISSFIYPVSLSVLPNRASLIMGKFFFYPTENIKNNGAKNRPISTLQSSSRFRHHNVASRSALAQYSSR